MWTPAASPALLCPYPPVDFGPPVGARFPVPLHIVRAPTAIPMAGDREAQYVLARPYRVELDFEARPRPWVIDIPAGLLTDLTSVPAVARPIVGRVGPHLEAAIVHDFLFVAWQDLMPEPRRECFDFANDAFAVLLRESRVGWFKRRLILRAVRSFVGWRVFKGRDNPRWVKLDPERERWDGPRRPIEPVAPAV